MACTVFCRKPQGCAPPAAVRSAHSAGVRVVKQHGDAVGGKDHQRRPDAVGDQPVAVLARGIEAQFVRLGNAANHVPWTSRVRASIWGSNPMAFPRRA